jgi:hypothetical protein
MNSFSQKHKDINNLLFEKKKHIFFLKIADFLHN